MNVWAPGALGSTDATHVRWDMAPYMEAVHYTGKEGFPFIAYEVTVDHIGRVLGVAAGFPGAKNDKTMIRFDKLITKIRSKDQYTQLEYTLVDAEGTEYVQRGAYVIVDGGYHMAYLPLLANSRGCKQRNWNDQLESVHKDVEFFFGRIKSHWRILKLPLQVHMREVIDEIFITCYILHFMLHT
ncbi:unnamed protein product [Discosporangium mesarthrocarpum]